MASDKELRLLELSTKFDILYDNIMSNTAPGLNEYEKSVLLTEALNMVVLSYCRGDNNHSDTFEKTEEVRKYLSPLVTTTLCDEDTTEALKGLSENSKFFNLPEDLLFITYEQATLKSTTDKCLDGKKVLVFPVEQDDYWYMSQNPFKKVSDNRAFRLNVSDNKVEIIAKDVVDKYLIRYIRKPNPIILIDLGDDLSIEGKHEASICELDPILDQEILNTAVSLAMASRTISNN